MQSVTIDQEFKNIIPPQTPEEHAGLEAMIIADGCREPLIVWGGVLVDGHNRYEICTRLNLPYKTEEKYFPSHEHVVEWIINNQFSRRNLLPYDRTKLALKLEDIYKARAKANQGARTDLLQNSVKSEKVNTQYELAKQAGVSHDQIHRVKKIEEKATDEQKADLSSGKISINKVYTDIKKKEEPKPGKRDMKANPYSNALQFSTIAISQLTRIREDDPKRVEALLEVRDYISQQLNNIGE